MKGAMSLGISLRCSVSSAKRRARSAASSHGSLSPKRPRCCCSISTSRSSRACGDSVARRVSAWGGGPARGDGIGGAPTGGGWCLGGGGGDRGARRGKRVGQQHHALREVGQCARVSPDDEVCEVGKWILMVGNQDRTCIGRRLRCRGLSAQDNRFCASRPSTRRRRAAQLSFR